MERLVSKKTSEEGEGAWEDHLAEPIDATDERFASLDEASRLCRCEEARLRSYAKTIHAYREPHLPSEELVAEDVR